MPPVAHRQPIPVRAVWEPGYSGLQRATADTPAPKGAPDALITCLQKAAPNIEDAAWQAAFASFEPVSVITQPVSGRSRTKISDIENSSSRDLPRDLRPSVRGGRYSSPETGLLAANPRKCRLFAERRRHPEETIVAGWAARIRTAMCRIRARLKNQLHRRPLTLGQTRIGP